MEKDEIATKDHYNIKILHASLDAHATDSRADFWNVLLSQRALGNTLQQASCLP